MEKFSEVLKNIRLKNGDSLRKLAEKTGVVFTYIDKIEKNERPVNKDILEKLLLVYPEHEKEFIQAYLRETLPESIVTKILKNNSLLMEDGTDREFIEYLINNSTLENRKSALELMVLQMEVDARKNGTYKDNKEEFEVLKKKIEKL